jgi:2,3-bisphosphoglycerate-dependent phosphoglycerate mutase
MALDGLTGDEIVKPELATGVPIVYRLKADSTVKSKSCENETGLSSFS